MWDFFVDSLISLFMPLVCSYFALTSNVFINIAAKDATGLEWLGNAVLAPVQFILVGQEANQREDGSWQFTQRFDYSHAFWIKTACSWAALPPSVMLGSGLKGLSLLGHRARIRHSAILAAKRSTQTRNNQTLYLSMGLTLGEPTETLISQGFQRKKNDENHLFVDKCALRDIGTLLNQAHIPWWVDCGTCLGAYRYGGVIPWDGDIDIAVLQPDFDNVQKALNHLDPHKYIVQDWSSREYPDSWYKVFIRTSGTMIDIYHFKILPETKEIAFVLAYDHQIFFPEWWKIRERRFKAPVAFDIVFPLKKATLDGVDIFVPNDTKKYLERYYGENLNPVKVYNPQTGLYEKDLTHPYWQRAFAH